MAREVAAAAKAGRLEERWGRRAEVGAGEWEVSGGLVVEEARQRAEERPELEWLVDVARFGVPVGFVGRPPTGRVPNKGSAEEASEAISALVAEEVEAGVLVDVTEVLEEFPEARGRNAPIAARAKTNGSTRMLVDHSGWVRGEKRGVNAGVDAEALGRVEMARVWRTGRELRRMRQACGDGEDVMLQVVDIASAFRRVPVAPADWPLLLLRWRGRELWDTRLPMGGAWSPFWMCRLSSALAELVERRARSRGQRTLVRAYVDDFLVAEVAARETTTVSVATELVGQLDRVGLQVSRGKLEDAGPPRATKEWLGFQWNMDTLTVSVPRRKVAKAVALIAGMRRRAQSSATEVAEVAGLLQHLATVVLPGRAFLWATSRCAAWLLREAGRGRRPLPPAVAEELDWWAAVLRKRALEWPLPRSREEATVRIATDASTTGGGFVCGTTRAWVVSWSRTWRSAHSTHLELLMVLVALRQLAPELAGTAVRVQVDNQATATVLTTGHAASLVLTRLLREVLLLAARFRFQLFSDWVPEALNRDADDLSRGRVAEWRARNPDARLRRLREPCEISWLQPAPSPPFAACERGSAWGWSDGAASCESTE